MSDAHAIGPWRLTQTEALVLKTRGNVKRSKIAARQLGMAPKTLDQHLFRAYRKMKAHHGMDRINIITAYRLWSEHAGSL